TLAAALTHRGGALLSDDICVLRVAKNGRLLAQPGHAHVRLWPDSITALDLDPEDYRPLRSVIEKRIVPFAADCSSEARSLDTIYLLVTANQTAIDITPIHGSERIEALL